jgi:peptidoglycan/LPS O-acetylase OafA/YrhL
MLIIEIAKIILVFITTITLSIIIYKFVDKPIQKSLRRMVKINDELRTYRI